MTNTYRNFFERRPIEDFFEYFNDFTAPQDYAAADWTITTTEDGSGSATEAIANAAGGVLVVTNDDADDDADFLQLAKEVFKFTTGKKLQFKARFKVSDATDSDVVIGLQITDTTPLDVTHGIYFKKDDGDANLDFYVEKSDTASSAAAIAALADDTYVVVEFYYDGAGNDIDYFVDGVRLGSLPLTNAPDDEELTVSIGIQNGEAAAKALSIDYLLVRQER